MQASKVPGVQLQARKRVRSLVLLHEATPSIKKHHTSQLNLLFQTKRKPSNQRIQIAGASFRGEH